MSKILDEFSSLIQGRFRYRARGFDNINCPACNDKRGRGGFARTDSGGFRYSCYNGGCPYNIQPTGWEPGNGLVGRTRALFELLGGSIKNIPISELRRAGNRNILDGRGNVIGRKTDEEMEVATSFPSVDPPRGSMLLEDAALEDDRAQAALDYLNHRSPLYIESDHPFLWSPEHPDHVILPFIHYKDQIVGYLGRHVNKSAGAGRFIQKVPPDYMFNQHLLSQGQGRYVIVTESPMEAVLLRGVGVRENRLTQKQINLLNNCGRTPILVPDQISDESKAFLATAKDNDWFVSAPDFGGKDAGVGIQKRGLLWTLEQIMSEKTKDYGKTKFRMKKKD